MYPPPNTILYRVTPDNTIQTLVFKRVKENRLHLEDERGVSFELPTNQYPNLSLSKRMALTELEEELRRRLDEIHKEMKALQIEFNPIDKPWVVQVTNANPPKEVHQYNKKTGRYLDSYPSLVAACSSVRPDKAYSGHISDVCNGKWKSAYGFRWSYEKLDRLPSFI